LSTGKLAGEAATMASPSGSASVDPATLIGSHHLIAPIRLRSFARPTAADCRVSYQSGTAECSPTRRRFFAALR
jgi:hypothetical protein